MKKILITALITALFILPSCGQFNQTDMPKKGDQIALLLTQYGTIKVRLFPDKAPEMVKNFTTLAKDKKYDGMIFHRVVKNFVIQGGDFTNANGTGGHSYKGPGTQLNDEISPDLKHIRGAVSMANAGPNTNGSQFFIVLPQDGTPFLDGGYSIFGQVFEGMEVVDTIAEMPVDQYERPLSEVKVERVEIMEYEPGK